MLKRTDRVGGEPVGSSESCDGAVLEVGEPVGSADPERAVGSGEKRLDVVAGEGDWLGVLVEDDEGVAVEADEADLGADPEEAVGGLSERLNGVLRKPVFHDPGLATVSGKRSAGLESERDGCQREKEAEKWGRAAE